MADAGALFLTSVQAIANTLIQYVIGVVAAYTNVVREEDLPGFSQMMNFMLVPILTVVSLGSGMSMTLFLSDGWKLALIGLVAEWEFTALALVLRRFVQPSQQFRRLFVLVVCFPNVVAIPLAVTQTLCELGIFDGEVPRAECVTRSRALIFM
mgnify:CR=1 FL=1|jgi:predicted permease